jgi:hypothetical protein
VRKILYVIAAEVVALEVHDNFARTR